MDDGLGYTLAFLGMLITLLLGMVWGSNMIEKSYCQYISDVTGYATERKDSACYVDHPDFDKITIGDWATYETLIRAND